MFRIYVGNISFNTTEDGLRELFGQYGQVHSVAIITDRDTGRSRGFGFVEMSNEGEGRAAITALDGLDFDDRKLTVNEARPRRAELSKATWHDEPTRQTARRTGTTNRHDEPARRTGTTNRHDEPAQRPQAIDWTTRDLLGWMKTRFESQGLEAPRIVAEMLLASVLGCDRMRLYMEADRRATEGEREALRRLVVRASAHEPVQYLVGRASFFAREFEVDPSTMIPQPSTEDLVSAVIDWWRQHLTDDGWGPLVADVGTGSGCIAVSLALKDPRVRVVATDVVPAALALARRNAERLGAADRITFAEGSLLEPLREHLSGASPDDSPRAFDCVCSNPPYISDREWEGGQVERSVQEYVPASARARRSRRARLPPSAHRGGAGAPPARRSARARDRLCPAGGGHGTCGRDGGPRERPRPRRPRGAPARAPRRAPVV